MHSMQNAHDKLDLFVEEYYEFLMGKLHEQMEADAKEFADAPDFSWRIGKKFKKDDNVFHKGRWLVATQDSIGSPENEP